MPPERLIRCPEFPSDLTWLNTTRPLTVAEDLRGRVALLDFWTYCCINCLHVLPVLARIEEEFRDRPVAVVGVHSAKFLSERDPENIRRAIARYGVRHPVVVDSTHDVWERFAVRGWPTIVLVDAAGYVRQASSGEVDHASLHDAVERLLGEGERDGILAPGPLDVAVDADADSTFLRFPGKVAIAGDLLIIADSGHNRIVAADRGGRVEAIVGEGGAGAHDGAAGEASFHDPQGLAVLGATLYVADRGNHLIRAVDLESWTVRTVAGSGARGEGLPFRPNRDPRRVDLRSPWGLLALGRQLLIAMAGSHQIWAYDPQEELIGPWAGSGREDHIDGPLKEAALAQPSGLTRAGHYVILADSEVSSVRAIDLQDGVVRTIVGRGLFDFGDGEGEADQVLLQHPLDVAAAEGHLYVADTYNNKIKAIELGSMRTRTIFGDGSRAVLSEPAGLAVDGGELFIADTNNHRLLLGDLKTGALRPFALRADA